MDSNTAYHFSRLLQTTPYLGHCSRVVKMERYRVCAAGREEEWREKFPRFRETRIVTRHRATRPVLITFRSASNFTLTRLSARRIFSFFFFLLLFPSKEKHSTTAQTSEGDRSAETISPPFLSPPLLLDEPIILRIDRSRGILPHVIVSKRYASNRILIEIGWRRGNEELMRMHLGLLLIDFTRRVLLHREAGIGQRHARPIRSISRINYDRSGTIPRLIRIRLGG